MSFDDAVADLAPALRGRTPAGLPYSPWQLLEHIRITQHDILDFCRNPNYEEITWPDDYWPKSPAPPSEAAWDASVREDRRGSRRASGSGAGHLHRPRGHASRTGAGRPICARSCWSLDHTAFHLGELIVARRLLGAWPR